MLKIPVLKPLLPTADKISPYLIQIDENRYYSNQGPLTKLFEKRLAKHFGVQEDTLVTSANGTLALTQILQAYDVKKGSLCVMPAWTFVATGAAAVAAGMTPLFIDVRKEDWIINPEDVYDLMQFKEIGAVIVVSPFGSPVDIDAWGEFHDKTNIPIIIDAAAGFDSLALSKRKSDVRVPIMISLHATKVFGVGEGAVVLTNSVKLAKDVRMYGNFGFHDSREAFLPGTNAKLNEYMSAVGLAGLDAWDVTREGWRNISKIFEELVSQNSDISLAPAYNNGWVSSYGIVEFSSNFDAHKIQLQLKQCGIGSVAWWGDGFGKSGFGYSIWKDK